MYLPVGLVCLGLFACSKSDSTRESSPEPIVIVADPTVAILDRGPTESHELAVGGATRLDPGPRTGIVGAVATEDHAAVLLLNSEELSIASIGLDGAIGPRVHLAGDSNSMSIAARDGTIAAVWTTDDDVVMFASFRARDLRPEAPPAQLLFPGSANTALTLRDRPGGWLVEYNDRDYLEVGLRLALLTSDGALARPTIELGAVRNVVALASGEYAAAFDVVEVDDNGEAIVAVDFVTLGSDGAIAIDPVRLSPRPPRGELKYIAGPLLEVGTAICVGLSEIHDEPIQDSRDPHGSWVATYIAVIEGGEVTRYPFQARVVDRSALIESLRLIDGDKLGVLWRSLYWEYWGPSMPYNYDLSFVLIDPATLTPLAAPVGNSTVSMVIDLHAVQIGPALLLFEEQFSNDESYISSRVFSWREK